MRRFVVVSQVLLAVALNASCGGDRTAAQLRSAERARAEGHFDQALDEYRLALVDAEDPVPVLIAMAETSLAAGETGPALDVLQSLVASAPDRPDVWQLLGRALAAEGRWNDAANALRRAVELDPADVSALHRLGIALVNAHRDAEAVEPFERAARLEPDPSAEVWTHWGAALHRTGRTDEARLNYERALAEDPGYVPALSNLAMLLIGDPDELDRAVALLEGVVRRRPGDAASLHNLGRAYLEADRPEEAFHLLQRAAAASPSSGSITELRLRDLRRAEARLPRYRPPPGSPNLMLVVIDTLRADHVGCYGYPRSTTPHIDAIAEGGVVFTNAVSAAPWTAPSMATMLTGVYPSVHGIDGGVSWPDGFQHSGPGLPFVIQKALSPSQPTLAEALRRHGYRTAGFVSNVYMHSIFGFSMGFETYHDRHEDYSADITRVKRRGGDTNRTVFDWLDDELEEPFFLLVHYNDPHWPYNPPAPHGADWVAGYRGRLTPDRTSAVVQRNGEPIDNLSDEDLRYLVGLYDGEIAYADAVVGELFGRLQELPLERPLVSIITSDHGEEFLDHGGGSHGYTLYEEQLAVPLVVISDRYRSPARIEVQVRTIDLVPTLLEIAGVEPLPAHLQGSSLVPLLRRAGSNGAERAFSEATYRRDLRAVRCGDGRKLIYDFTASRGELYDLASDPAERFNLSASHGSIMNVLSRDLAGWITGCGELRSLLFAGRTGPQEVVVDPAIEERLRALGYLAD